MKMKMKIIYICIIIVVLFSIILYNAFIVKENYEKNSKKTLKIKLSNQIKKNYLLNKDRFSMVSDKQFFGYFLPRDYDYTIVNENEKSDISIYDIYIDNNDIMKDNEINMLISIENLPFWNHYAHYTNYGNYGNNKMNIYLYNHITKINRTKEYISIPLAYNFINYYKTNEKIVKPKNEVDFKKKKFALAINKSERNTEINDLIREMKKIGQVDDISLYNDIIADKSAYHSEELLSVFNKYKFIICYENSYADGYVTEKIFNCLFSKSIPLYKGASNITEYIHEKSFIDLRDIGNSLKMVKLINNDEKLYNNMINHPKISEKYDDENYQKELVRFIENRL